jgi:hypothetical protein
LVSLFIEDSDGVHGEFLGFLRSRVIEFGFGVSVLTCSVSASQGVSWLLLGVIP